MLRWMVGVGATLVVIAGAGFWWLFLDASPPKAATATFNVPAYRALVAGDSGAKPAELRIEIIGEDSAPSIAAEAGNFLGTFDLVYSSFQIVFPESGPTLPIVVGGAVDEETAAEIRQSATAAQFDGMAMLTSV